MNGSLMLEVKDLPELLKIGVSTAWKLTRTEGFPVVRIGNRILIPRQALEEWIEKKMNRE